MFLLKNLNINTNIMNISLNKNAWKWNWCIKSVHWLKKSFFVSKMYVLYMFDGLFTCCLNWQQDTTGKICNCFWNLNHFLSSFEVFSRQCMHHFNSNLSFCRLMAHFGAFHFSRANLKKGLQIIHLFTHIDWRCMVHFQGIAIRCFHQNRIQNI